MKGCITRLVAKERADRHAPAASYSCVRLLGELSRDSLWRWARLGGELQVRSFAF
jgi:hypothetical protein